MQAKTCPDLHQDYMHAGFDLIQTSTTDIKQEHNNPTCYQSNITNPNLITLQNTSGLACKVKYNKNMIQLTHIDTNTHCWTEKPTTGKTNDMQPKPLH